MGERWTESWAPVHPLPVMPVADITSVGRIVPFSSAAAFSLSGSGAHLPDGPGVSGSPLTALAGWALTISASVSPGNLGEMWGECLWEAGMCPPPWKERPGCGRRGYPRGPSDVRLETPPAQPPGTASAPDLGLCDVLGAVNTPWNQGSPGFKSSPSGGVM